MLMFACVTYITQITQVTLKTINNMLLIYIIFFKFSSFQYFGSQTQAGGWCALLGLDPYIVSCFLTMSAETGSLNSMVTQIGSSVF